MSLIDSHVEGSSKQCTVINRVDLAGRAEHVFPPALLQIKQPAIPVLRCHHSTLTKEKRDQGQTHGHTGDPSIRQHHPRMHLHLHLRMHRHTSI